MPKLLRKSVPVNVLRLSKLAKISLRWVLRSPRKSLKSTIYQLIKSFARRMKMVICQRLAALSCLVSHRLSFTLAR